MREKLVYVLLIVFLMMMLQGIFLGEVARVIRNGIMVCLQCIGVG